MDIWGFVLFFFLAFLIMSCCGYCCSSKKRGAVLSTPVVVTSATHTAPGGYPVTQMPVPATGYQTNIYTAPYPPQMNASVQMHMPMPMPMPGAQPPAAGMQQYPYTAPYPPMATQAPAASNMNPPSYDMAVTQPANAAYEKQSPYNPNFSAH